jgi:hypothetical protein
MNAGNSLSAILNTPARREQHVFHFGDDNRRMLVLTGSNCPFPDAAWQ